MSNKRERDAIRVENITKTFNIPIEAHSGIKQKIINAMRGIKGTREFTPLKNVTFNISEGEFFGIVGRNGSGKSTLLKTIAGIYTPGKGQIHVRGKLVPFIELGVGFNPELTGRENVYLNSALLGFSHEQTDEMYREIVEFAELHEFMEEKLKNYSSGMQVRLAFSIAIRARADVLLLDEVLAVGDESFQRKCYAYFDDLRRQKKTVVLVTHDMRAIEKYCDRALLLDDGNVLAIGSAYEVSKQYSKLNAPKPEETPLKDSNEDDTLTEGFKAVIQAPASGQESRIFGFNEKITINLSWNDQDIKNVGVAIIRRDGEYVFGTNTFNRDDYTVKNKSASLTFDANLYEGDYFIKAGLFGETEYDKIKFLEDGPTFTVMRSYDNAEWGGITKLSHKWSNKDV